MPRAIARATTKIKRLHSAAIHSVRRVPKTSSAKKLVKLAPTTAPSALAPYSSAMLRRPTSAPDSTDRAAAGMVPPIKSVGAPSTSALSSSRAATPPTGPSATLPPRCT